MELYRLTVVETWPDSIFKAATITAIQHKHECLGLDG
jgi:hypothetical protein